MLEKAPLPSPPYYQNNIIAFTPAPLTPSEKRDTEFLKRMTEAFEGDFESAKQMLTNIYYK